MSDIRFTAKTYIDAGWAVVPVDAGLKKASTSWQKKTYAPQDFGPKDNIAGKCGEPSGWRVDVDCDAMEAVIAAKILLPHTQMIHGRPGKPDSHYWFICEGIKTSQFTDIKSASGGTQMLIEIRSTGGYTLLPPSIWTNKADSTHTEDLAWTIERQAMVIQGEVLYVVVRNVAIATLCARHWPGSGARHATVGHLAGFLCLAGLHPRDVLKVIEATVTAANDPDKHDRMNFAKATVAKFENGEQVTGGPKLAEEIGEAVVAKMRSWLKVADGDALEEMNAKHFIIRIGKDEVIGTEDGDDVIFQRRRDLELRYANRIIQTGEDEKGKPTFEPILHAWLKAKTRREYRTVTFAPPPIKPDPRDYNLWKGFAISPAPGDCHLFLEHIQNIICSGNSEYARYLCKLLAFTVQNPGIPSEVAVVLRGEPGTGKGVFIRALTSIFGTHATHLDKVDQLVGHFNGPLSAKVIVFADEAFWAGDKREVGALKRLITEPTMMIERKGLDAVPERNCIHLFMATNEDWAIPAMLAERRFFALNVSNAQRQDVDYFDALLAEMASGGIAAFLQMLMDLPVTKAEILRVPRTNELRVQQSQSLPPELKWWQELLFDNATDFGAWVPVGDLHQGYMAWMRERGGRIMDKIEFGRRMSKFFSDTRAETRRHKGELKRCTKLRTLPESRKHFDKELGTEFDWGDPPSAATSPTIPF